VLDAYPSKRHNIVKDLLRKLVALLQRRRTSSKRDAEALADAAYDEPQHKNIREILEPRQMEILDNVTRRNKRLASKFVPRPCDGDMLFFGASPNGKKPAGRTLAEWKSYVVGEITVHEINSKHSEMLLPNACAQLGPILNAALGSRSARGL